MTKKEVLQELKAYGNESTKNTFLRHGAKEPFFGVKTGDLKKIQKKIKTDHKLALELFDTGNSDAMYFAGMIADADQITEAELDDWAKKAYWYMLSEYTVAWLAADSPLGMKMGLKWIESDNELIASAGWSALSNWASVTDDSELDIKKFSALLDRVKKEVHHAPNRVRYVMNGFVISIGSYIKSLTAKATKIAEAIGKVDVNVGNTSCKVPLATDYIKKVVDRGTIGKKRKMARC